MQNTKHSLKTSLTALLLCFVMLVGTTFAWFTDEVTSANNIIKAGNLDIGMSWSFDNTNWNDVEGDAATPVLSRDIIWEPGYTAIRYIKVSNLGSLAFKYKMAINPTGTAGDLADVIDVSYDVVTGNSAFVAPTADNKKGSLTEVGSLSDLIDANGIVAGGVLLPANELVANYFSGEIVICVAFHMDEFAGNDYQDSSIGTDFGINLYATQFDYENDSFDNSYDDNATWPDEMNFDTTVSLGSVQTLNNELTSDLTIRYNDSIYAVLPTGVKLADGVDSLSFSGKAVENTNNIIIEDANSSKSYDIHIEGIADDNQQPIKVYLGAILDKNLGDTELKLYHESTPMTKVNSVAEFGNNNQYTYDPATGDVVLYVDNFSVFSSIQTTADVWDGVKVADGFASGSGTEADPYIIETAAQLVYFRNQVDAGNSFKGKFVKLGKDIDLNNKSFDPIGFGYWNESKVVDGTDTNTVFMGTFDGGNHTIYHLHQNCWELDPDKKNYSTYTYSTAGAGLFASIKNATIKNLAVSGAEIVFECVDMGIVVGYAQGTCHFENIVVTDSKIANYNRYTGGVVGEVSYGPYGTDINEGYSHTFKNVTVDSTVTVSGLWGSFGCGMGGVIGGKWGDATVKMENVISAPVMDVYNDVVSAYQWYAFRGCGMLIGHTEEPYSDGRHSGNATASFLTCEGVKVYYGDWVEYHYYEFENQDSDKGKSYPWVRAEAGNYCDAFSNIRYGVPTFNGKKVSDMTAEELAKVTTDYTPIVFNQLYGADRGMYGTDKHEGVTVVNKNTKTIYFMNANEWTDLKLHYYYVNGDDTWTNVPDGISLGEAVNKQGTRIYKVTVPAYANEFYITGAKDGQNTKTINASVAELIDGYVYYMTADQIKHCEYKEGYKTVYFENNKGWSDVYLYYWCHDGKADWGTIEFPGEKMNLVSSEGVYDVYSFVIPAYADGFVFSDGKENVTGTEHYQSVDVKLTADPDGKIFYLGSIDNNQVVDGNKVNYKYSVYSTQYKSGYTTIYFQNNWRWEDVEIYYTIDGTKNWSQGEIKLLGYYNNDEYYSAVLPNYATKFNISGERDVSSERQQTVSLSLSSYPTNSLIKLTSGSGSNVNVSKSTYSTSTKLTGYKTIYLTPGVWTADGAWFNAWIWGSSQSDRYVTFRDLDGDGIYEAIVPSDTTNIKIYRKGSIHSKQSSSCWNHTGDQTISGNMITVKNWDNYSWSTKK